MDEFLSLFSNYAFPTAVCIYLFVKDAKDSQRHKEEVDSLRTALENNTLVLQKLYEKIGGEGAQ